MRPAYQIYRLAWSSLDLFFPPNCGGCGAPGNRLCHSCENKIRILPSSICQICGSVLDHPGLCSSCQNSSPSYKALRSWAFYEGPLRSAIHKLKYSGDMSLGEILARHLYDLWNELDWEVDMITPVPLGLAHHAERGYNQAAFLARPLALRRGIKYRPQALKKIRETRSQVGLTYSQRLENVADAFCSDSNLVGNRIILVVDDVTTSGATMESCAKALLIAGAKSVFGLTLARTAHPAQF